MNKGSGVTALVLRVGERSFNLDICSPLLIPVVDFVTGRLLFAFYLRFLSSIEILFFLSFFVNFFLLAASFISCVFLNLYAVYLTVYKFT